MPPPLKKQRSSQPKEYRQFDPLTKTIRDAAIKGCVDIYLKHVKDNGGACKRGFLQSIVVTANEKASGLQITRDDIIAVGESDVGLEERDGWRRRIWEVAVMLLRPSLLLTKNQRLAMVFPLAWLGRGSRSAKMQRCFT